MPRTFSTVQGQAWDEIAREVYGRESAMDHLLAANPDYQGQLTLPANAELTVPKLPSADTPPTPPWDR